MEMLLYLYKTTFKNRFRKALRKPATYIYAVIIIAYFVFMYISLRDGVKGMKMDSPEGVYTILAFIVLTFLPGNFIAYSKRKGLLFRKSDVHFLFTTPINPKLVLLFAHFKNIIMGFIIGIIFVPIGILWFHIHPVRMILYFLVSQIIENILESSLMLLVYGNETLSERSIKIIGNVMKGFIAIIVLIGVVLFFVNNRSLTFLPEYISHPALLMVPVIGWIMASYQLIFLGATTLNLICTCLYVISTVVMLALAIRMKCTGEYYENAMKFADDYAEAREKSKKGEVAFVGKKTKYGKATIEYKGTYGKAILYRQLLEYKKSKTFIFGFMELICLAAGIFLTFMSKDDKDAHKLVLLIVFGASSYVSLIFSGLSTKWAKELDNPYTFLIPDSAIRKLWYATVIEHVRAVVDGVLLVTPLAIVLRMNPIEILLGIFIFVCVQANKLYLTVLCEAILGNTLGQTAKQWLRMLAQTLCIGVGVFVFVLLMKLVSVTVAVAGLIAVVVVITAVVAVGASVVFRGMEI
jgi:hypothetical protein